MADFDDITGWREELQTFKIENSDPWIAPGEFARAKVPLELPYSTAYRLIELYLTDSELRKALDLRIEWGHYIEQQGSVDLDDPKDRERFPEEAFNTLDAFSEWYCQKLGIYQAHIKLGSSAQLTAIFIADGKFPAVRSSEAKQHLDKSRLFKFREEK